MTVAFDPSTDFETVADGLQAVTLRPQNNPNTPLLNERFSHPAALALWTTIAGTPSLDEGMAYLPGSNATRIGREVLGVAGVTYEAEVLGFTTVAALDTFTLNVGTTQWSSNLVATTWANTRSRRFRTTFVGVSGTEYLSIGGSPTTADWRIDDVLIRATADVAITSALRRDVSIREVTASNGLYEVGDVAWHLPKAQAATPPEMGDLIIDANADEWIVLEVQWQTLHNRWRCVSRRLRVIAATDTYIQIYRHSPTAKSSDHADALEWSSSYILAHAVRAAIHELDAGNEMTEDTNYFAKAYEFACEIPVPVDPRCRVVDTLGNSYAVTGFRNPNRNGDLFTITAERTPWALP